MKLWIKILIALFAGVVVGLVGKRLGFSEPIGEVMRPVGDIFIKLINMLVVLLIFSSVTVGVTSIHDPAKLGRVGIKSLLLYLGTTMCAIIIGICFAYLLKPGEGVGLTGAELGTVTHGPTLTEMLMGIIPSNPINSLAEGNILQVIVFSIFLGFAINMAGGRAKPVMRFIESLAEIMYKMTAIVMALAPYGVFAIMSWVAGSYGWVALTRLAVFLIANYLACLVHSVVVFGGILVFGAKLNPIRFLRGLTDALVLAFTTSSSSATLPVTMRCVQENLGVSKNISSFVLPLGATVNMNGAAIFQAIAALFVAQAYGIDLGIQQLAMITLTATLSSVGAAGIPGSSLIVLTVVLTSVGLPLEGVALVYGVDRIREMVSTMVNVMGDAVVAVYVAKTEGELDEEQYNEEELAYVEEIEL